MQQNPEGEIFKPCIKCNKCNAPVHISWNHSFKHRLCKKCDEVYDEIRCANSSCNFRTLLCFNCLTPRDTQKEIKPQPKEDNDKSTLQFILTAFAICICIILAIIGLRPMGNSETSNSEDYLNTRVIERLRAKFPLQKNETLYHILSVLEQGLPTVKSITLLHKNDMKTSQCLAKEVVNVFNESAMMEEVTFDIDGIKYTDYGEVLEYYHSVVKRFRVLVTNLSEVPAKVAKIFHSLCDEVASDVKPSLFIFILRQKKETDSKPLEKATAILKEAWRELPDSDLFPLLSRVVKNVVDVIPEKNAVC